ncbi:hypothetical protein lbkm_2782 [Lachnospiraceae bacterium KM106-2]|nr:hypothetical protein lbkm_2782 [Lachnospiraceae bacterium KM106-2]
MLHFNYDTNFAHLYKTNLFQHNLPVNKILFTFYCRFNYDILKSIWNKRGLSMNLLPGVYTATTKKGELYYRSSITINRKHISLGSYPTEEIAHQAYLDAGHIYYDSALSIPDYANADTPLDFIKWVALINYRDNGIYIKTPIYLKKQFFFYYLSEKQVLKFDTDDLFYYSAHKIMQRGGHLFVSEYGMQVNILNRYGIKNYAVAGKDYCFANQDSNDFRYHNIEVTNRYHGVARYIDKGRFRYIAKIIINGSYIIGRYSSEEEAAIAYNKAAALLKEKGAPRNYPENYIEHIDAIEYAALYNRIRISKKIRDYSFE